MYFVSLFLNVCLPGHVRFLRRLRGIDHLAGDSDVPWREMGSDQN